MQSVINIHTAIEYADYGDDMLFLINDVEHRSYKKGENVDIKQYYDMMRNKEHIKTSLLSPEDYSQAFRPILESGKDILYIGFSSGLSGTYQSSKIAADILADEFPERKIIAWDSLCASMGEGLMVYYAAKMKEEGKSIDEVSQWAEEHRLNTCHWFTVDDLFFLKRGGRVSAATAVAVATGAAATAAGAAAGAASSAPSGL